MGDEGSIQEVIRTGFTIVVAACTILMTAIVAKEFLFTGPAAIAPDEPELVEDWDQLRSIGHSISGKEDAVVTIVVFSDFECPFCRRFALETLPAIEDTFPGQVQTLFRHWPLENHRLAYPAARAAECAGGQGRFREFHDLLFAKADSLGLKSFDSFAAEVGVADIEAFRQCNSAHEPVQAIEMDIMAVRAIGGVGTPTLVINGIKPGRGAPPATVVSLIRESLGK